MKVIDKYLEACQELIRVFYEKYYNENQPMSPRDWNYDVHLIGVEDH